MTRAPKIKRNWKSETKEKVLKTAKERLREMRQQNHQARRMGDEPVWSDSEIEELEELTRAAR